jgi:transposase
MIGSIRLDGSTTCMTIEAATDKEIFGVYVERILLPALKPGDTVIMDNLSSHKGEQILKMIEQAGCQARFLPAYSPDLNPIEKMWSKIKTLLRSAKARSTRALNNAIAKALKKITSTDAQNWFASCGYSIT